MQVRPLGTLSNLVANIGQLLDVSAFCSQLDLALELVTEGSIQLLCPQALRVANYDLAAAVAICKTLQVQPPTILNQLLRIAGKRLGVCEQFNYTHAIFLNPRSDMRTFHEGEIGVTEKIFYTTHHSIELALLRVHQALNMGDIVENQDAGQQVADAMWLVTSLTGSLAAMPNGHFGEIRKFFHGASGLQSPGVALLELLLWGHLLTPEHRRRIAALVPSFESSFQTQVRVALMNAESGLSASSSINAKSRPLICVIAQGLLDFRIAHKRVVQIQLPEVATGNALGSAGKPMQFLEGEIERTQQLRLQLGI